MQGGSGGMMLLGCLDISGPLGFEISKKVVVIALEIGGNCVSPPSAKLATSWSNLPHFTP